MRHKTLQSPYLIILFSIVTLIFTPKSADSQTLDTWVKISGAALDGIPVYSVEVMPNYPDTIFVGCDNSRIFRTYDGGTNWTDVSLGAGAHDIRDMVINPANNEIVVTTNADGVYLSTDLGANWAQSGLAGQEVFKLEQNPTAQDTIFAVVDNGVYTSINGGTTWNAVNNGLAGDVTNVRAISHSGIDASRIYVGTNAGRVFHTNDYGVLWTLRGTITGTVISEIIVDQVNPDIIYVSTLTDGVYKSTDAGASFSQLPVNLVADDIDILSMEIDTSSTPKIYMGSNGNGAFSFVLADTAINAINLGLPTGVLNALESRPDDPHMILTGTNTVGVYEYIGNRYPVLTPIGDLQANVGVELSFTVTATDVDTTDILSFVGLDVPTGAIFDSLATRVFSWTPAVSDTGDHDIAFWVSDARGGTDYDSITVNVNRIPVISTSDTTIAGIEDSLITITVSGTDADSDSLTFSASSLPTGAVFVDTLATPTFSWTPGYEQAGSYTVNFTIDDGRSGIATLPVDITVANKNRAPYFSPALTDKSVSEGQNLGFFVTGQDDDGDAITFGLADSLPNGASFDSLGSQRFSWIPTYEDSGSYDISFTVSDGLGGSTTDTITVTVVNENRDPVISPLTNVMYHDTLYAASLTIDTLNVNEGVNLKFEIVAVDADSDSVSYNVAKLPQYATLNFVTGQFNWTPSFDQQGVYEVIFNARDVNGGSSFKQQYIKVNQPPVWSAVQGQFTQEGVRLQFALAATDADSDSVVYYVSNAPDSATVTLTDSIHFDWTPQDGDAGMYAVSFTADDSSGGVETVIVPIQVAESSGQLLPIFFNLEDKTVNENQRLVFQVIATDDSPQDSLVYDITGLPTGAEFDTTGSQIFDWTPDYDQSGVYKVYFSVTDTSTNTVTDSIDITVQNVNRAPTSSVPTDTTIAEGDSIQLPLNILDPDGDTITIVYFEIPPGATIDSTGTHEFNWVPSYLQEGVYHLKFTASDDSNETVAVDLTITVENTNRIPTGFSIVFPLEGEEVMPTDYLIWTRADDPDIDDTLSYVIQLSSVEDFSDTVLTVPRFTSEGFLSKAGSIASSLYYDRIQSRLAEATGDAFIFLVNDIPNLDSLIDDSVYYWRVKAFDNRGSETDFSATAAYFHLNLENDPPAPPSTTIYPIDGRSVNEQLPTFRWIPPEDPDYSDTYLELSYAFELDRDNFTSGYDYRVVTEAGVDSVPSPVVLQDNEEWYYRIKAYDDDGDSSAYSTPKKFLVNLSPEPPTRFDLQLPVDNFGYVSRPDSIKFDWEDSVDPDPDGVIHYLLELSTSQSFEQEYIVVFIDSISSDNSGYSLSADILSKNLYYWRVMAYDNDSMITYSTSIFAFGLITSVTEVDGANVPKSFTVDQNYPNPFNNHTVVRFGINRPTPVDIMLFSSTGRLVYSEKYSILNSGYHYFRWNGQSSAGKPVASGVYLLRIAAGNEYRTRKLILIK